MGNPMQAQLARAVRDGLAVGEAPPFQGGGLRRVSEGLADVGQVERWRQETIDILTSVEPYGEDEWARATSEGGRTALVAMLAVTATRMARLSGLVAKLQTETIEPPQEWT